MTTFEHGRREAALQVAEQRKAARRLRTSRIRFTIATLAVAVFAGPFGFIYSQLANGQDPALVAKATATTTKATTKATPKASTKATTTATTPTTTTPSVTTTPSTAATQPAPVTTQQS